MKISLDWLNDYVNVGLPPEKLAHRLTMAGLEVEKIFSVGSDHVFELEITPNRPDCLSLLGIARETAAVLNKRLKYPKIRQYKRPSTAADVTVLDREACSRYIGIVIKDVAIRPFSEQLSQRLEAVGLRGINNVVDITNYCLMEYGQPMHAFDYDKLIGGKIIVRRARKGETIITIDGQERQLDPSILVIADAQRPVAIAGIMGGQDTEVTNKTKNILLESAYFDPLIVRRVSRLLGLSSDSSYRFERGVDIQTVETAARRAVALIREQAGGVLTQMSDVFPIKRKLSSRLIEISVQTVGDSLGAQLPMARCKTILKNLEFRVVAKSRTKLLVTPPSYRRDVSRTVDCVEEIARMIGYDQLPMTLPQITVSNIVADRRFEIKERLRRILQACGGYETVTYTMIHRELLEKSRQAGLTGVEVSNPLSQDQQMMRPSLLPSFLQVLRTNLYRGQKDLQLFELGKKYLEPEEKEVIGILMTGRRRDDWRETQKAAKDFYDLKGVVERIYRDFDCAHVRQATEANDIFARGEGVGVYSGKQLIGIFGKLHPQIIRSWDLKVGDVFFAELDMAPLYLSRHTKNYVPPSEYPPIVRDVSLAVNPNVTFQQVVDLIRSEQKELLTDIRFLEEYRGEKIPTGQRGMVFSLVFQSPSRTLTEEEVNRIHEKICSGLISQLGATIR